MTAPDDPRLNGRHPEFSRMSRHNGGIGSAALHDVASTLLQFNLETSQADVPVSLRHGSRMLPLGRYLRRYLRTLIGKEAAAPEEIIKALSDELLPLRLAARSSSSNPSLKGQILETSKGEIDQMLAKHRIYKQRKSL